MMAAKQAHTKSQTPAGEAPADGRGDVARRVEGPARSCVACRQVGARGELVRLVEAPDGAIAVDPRSRVGGRGAWVHPTRACLFMAAKRHAAERSLKVAVRADVSGEALVAGVTAGERRRFYSLVGVAWRTRAIAVGADATATALENGRVPLVLVAVDAAEATRGIAPAQGSDGGVHVRTFGSRQELGHALGRAEVAIVAVTDRRIAHELVSTVDRIAGLEG